ncbi:SDR family oxidoreductase [Flavobacterium sp. TP390]|uniref:SDR family oxidoreductase n=1 Tax=Flavobacterium profundi TaxID=1774945 RepID=A0A6I4IJB4_9FLAO|nr:SDR family oxidoreductase [Flavobacterium profundi]MVO09684.1 SDR family oxidoreductase [Flavobacterium profundi]
MNKNKIALVTGGSRGLGKNMVVSLAKKGFDVVFTYHSNSVEAGKVEEEVQQLGQKAASISLDTSKTNTFDAFKDNLEKLLKENFQAEKIDFLINNAGIGIHASFEETTEEQFDLLFNIHLKGVYFLSQKLVPMLQDGGGIVNISTGLARFTTPGYAAYATMKGGIEVLTRYQAKELGARKIRVNTVAPGAIETDFGGGVVRDNKDLNQFISSMTALGRVGLPDDIGGVVAFLCTEDANWINGQRIEISGGMML